MMPQKEPPSGTEGLTKAGRSAITKIEDFELTDLDCIGQKWPEMKAGNKSILYFLFAVSCLINPTQAAWASMQLVMVPIVVGLISGVMGVMQAGKAFEEDEDEACSDQDEVNETVDVLAKEVEETSSVTQFPTNSARVRQSYQIGSEKPPASTDEQEEPKFVDNPWSRPRPQPRYESPAHQELVEKVREIDRNIHSPVPSTPSPEMAKFRAPAMTEDLLKMPVKERAKELLDHLELSGCDLWSYINDPILVCQGTQQSGKSTLAVIVSVLEAALYGKRINYITSNGDIYPVQGERIRFFTIWHSFSLLELAL
ncbi:MAG: hypothetical protein AAGE59_34280 [Cyanobacteria bacterium P01_F01_bin.86]